MKPEEMFGMLLGSLVSALLSAWTLWMIWPWVMVEVFHLPELAFVKAWDLVMIGYCLVPLRFGRRG